MYIQSLVKVSLPSICLCVHVYLYTFSFVFKYHRPAAVAVRLPNLASLMQLILYRYGHHCSGAESNLLPNSVQDFKLSYIRMLSTFWENSVFKLNYNIFGRVSFENLTAALITKVSDGPRYLKIAECLPIFISEHKIPSRNSDDTEIRRIVSVTVKFERVWLVH